MRHAWIEYACTFADRSNSRIGRSGQQAPVSQKVHTSRHNICEEYRKQTKSDQRWKASGNSRLSRENARSVRIVTICESTMIRANRVDLSQHISLIPAASSSAERRNTRENSSPSCLFLRTIVPLFDSPLLLVGLVHPLLHILFSAFVLSAELRGQKEGKSSAGSIEHEGD